MFRETPDAVIIAFLVNHDEVQTLIRVLALHRVDFIWAEPWSRLFGLLQRLFRVKEGS